MRTSGEGKTHTLVEGRQLALTHLDKVLWPETGFTKRQALHYYARVAPAMLPHVAGRPASFVRFPEGVDGPRFYTKNPPPGTPEWVHTVRVPGREGPKPHVAVDDLPTLMIMANLGALEIHVPQWRGDTPDAHDRLVIDLDPGPGMSVLDCARVALLIRGALADDGLTARPKTSGSKGLHLYVPLVPTPAAEVVDYARSLAVRLTARHPDLIVHSMAKALRPGRVLVDWSQNATAKTTAAPYTLRAGPRPTVSAPVSWERIEAARRPPDLTYPPERVLADLDRHGDPLAVLTDPAAAHTLP
jgi:bifunctional non-homologous end joining protein LigD